MKRKIGLEKGSDTITIMIDGKRTAFDYKEFAKITALALIYSYSDRVFWELIMKEQIKLNRVRKYI